MLFKLIALVVFVVIVASLGKALFHMSRPSEDDGGKMLRALTWRIALSVLLFVALVAAYYLGWISPH
jgi:uncharacterized BrkB/YihY/UPF0761 family membrane protein